METAQASGSQARSSSGSTKPHGSRTTNPDKQISQIEKSVTHLLVATKQLLETLTQWSRGNAQEEEVSDVYVRLGYEFNLACRAFNSIGVETNDLGPVPDLLRSILEDTLSQPASPQALDNYLPRIRDIIINLLHGLKRKQSKLRNRPAKESIGRAPGAPPRQTSVTSVQSTEVNPVAALGTVVPDNTIRQDGKLESLRFTEEPQPATNDAARTTSLNRSSLNRPSQRTPSRRTPTPDANTAGLNQPAPDVLSIPIPEPNGSLPPIDLPFPYGPPPPPKQDALTALQKGPDLERRASRRFSAYQIQKHLGASPNGVPVIPPAQNSPIPNRGREVRESLTAVRSRTSFQNKRSATRLQEISPGRGDPSRASNRISEEREEAPQLTSNQQSSFEPPNEESGSYSPTIKTPDEYVGSFFPPTLAATLNGPMSPPGEFNQKGLLSSQTLVGRLSDDDFLKSDNQRTELADVQRDVRAAATPSPTMVANLDLTPPQGKELTLFLQYKSKIKKIVISEEFEGLTMARLQLAFIEKFAWNTHNNGVDLPEIYVQDPVSGVRHELEDLSDVKDRCVLVLNVEVLDEVKKHFDEGIGGLKTTLDSVRSLLDGQSSMFQRFSDRQLETSKEMARLSTTPLPRSSRAPTLEFPPKDMPVSSEPSLTELQNLRRDIAVLRQTYNTMSSDFTATMSEIKVKAAVVKEAAAVAVAPSYEGDAGRYHVNQGKKQLSTDSEALVNRVDDLTDLVEDLRKDVVTRGVRPLPRQLEDVNKEVMATARQLSKMKEFLKREKPIWTKIWEKELDQVCTERDELTQQEDLVSDLDGDLQDVTDVFKLVEEAMKQQTLQATGRNAVKQFDYATGVDLNTAKDGLLGEVRALKPNHETRLQAIERAEKAREKELKNRDEGEFKREVKEFVEDGKLKKVGGMDEVERQRKLKDERARKENWERQQAREAEKEMKRQAEAAAKAAQEAAAKEQAIGSSESQAVIEASDVTSNMPDALATTRDSRHDPTRGSETSASSFHDATTVQSQNQQLVDKPLPQRPIGPQYDLANSPRNSADVKREDRPPQLPEVRINDENDSKEEEVDQTEPGLNKKTSKDSSWWKPAIF